MIKILIAEDSPVTLEYVKHILASAGDFEVVSTAKDGEKAVAFAQTTGPDVILMDINMPRMDGFEATRRIMETKPVPIVIFSASWNPEDVEKTFKAMEAGALTVLEKPAGPGSPDAEHMIRELLQTLRLMSEVPVVRRWNRQREKPASPGLPSLKEEVEVSDGTEIVAIGSSTGGPSVLNAILSMLPKDFSAPILIVQHISEGFQTGLAEWLEKSCYFSVCVARHNNPLEPGHVYMSPDKLHMGVTKEGRIALSDAPPENYVRPSVSYLFRSVAREFGRKAAGVLLTGMGKDGANELKLIKESGGVTIVQDKESSVVHGMAGEAIKLDAAKYVLTPEKIAAMLASTVSKK